LYCSNKKWKTWAASLSVVFLEVSLTKMAAGKMMQITLPIVDPTWDRCYDFKNIFAKKFSEKIGVFDSKQS
jgi:hypothetical protein